MSLITQVGRRSFRPRLLIGAVYLLLATGATTMVVPFLLMLAIATTSEGDYRDFQMVPDYWTSDAALFRKVVVDAAKLDQSATWVGRDDWFSPTDVRPEHFAALTAAPAAGRAALARDWRDFLATGRAERFRIPLFVPNPDSPTAAADAYRAFLRRKYGSVAAANAAHQDNAAAWEDFALPKEPAHRLPDASTRMRDYRAWVATLSADRSTVYDADADVLAFLKTLPAPSHPSLPRGGDGKVVLARVTYEDVMGPAFDDEQRRRFFAERASMRFTRLDPATAGPAWGAFRREAGLAPAPLAPTIPADPAEAAWWARFIQTAAPVGALAQDRPEDAWRAFLLERYGSWAAAGEAHDRAYAAPADARIPRMEVLYDAFAADPGAVRRAYLGHNFRTVFQVVAVNGNALMNTVIYILLAVGGALTVNPMAAYALSRFRLKEGHQVLVFLLATMAFPGEVLMIPGFLQVGRFPLAALAAAAGCLLLFLLLQRRLRGWPVWLRTTVALALVGGVAVWGVPRALGAAGVSPDVSLMNTFWALVLPGLANGYGIFLLKGFFDSLPPELYEAGLLDGAGEWKMFHAITLPLCKPILAVMALGTFTAAYGAFMHAFLVTQDPRMWTLMVFLYQFQQTRSLPMVMASLVVAAIPTLIVFVLAQRVILRGIVIPTYK